MNDAQTFANDLIETMTKMDMTDFFEEVHSQYFPKQSGSFMEYFLELMENENEFMVPHKKLIEYGIMSASGDMKKKLEKLSLVEDEDYEMSESPPSAKRQSRNYYLTPSAFKTCLMCSSVKEKEFIGHRDHYLLLEKIYKLFTDYERSYSEKLISMKEDEINELQSKLKNLKLKGKASTSEKDSHNFVILQSEMPKTGLKTLSFIAGKTATTQMKKKMADSSIKWSIVKKTNVADPTELRTSINVAIVEYVNKELTKIDDARLLKLDKLKDEISRHNERRPKDKRSFATEKKELKKVYRKDIPIKSLKLTTTYEDNDYILYKDLLKVILSKVGKD